MFVAERHQDWLKSFVEMLVAGVFVGEKFVAERYQDWLKSFAEMLVAGELEIKVW